MQVLQGVAGARISALRTMYPSALEVVSGEVDRSSKETSTTYGYVLRGSARICTDLAVFELREGGYIAIPGGFVAGVDGVLVLIERIGFRGMLVAGAIEERGRLSYIDGCSDSILVAPPRLGDPVLNHLHFPRRTVQTLHSHPSIRLGIVARGFGIARGVDSETALRTGDVFLLPEHQIHAFTTVDSSMDVIAFHPDSDHGPTDADHPMINRTFIANKTA